MKKEEELKLQVEHMNNRTQWHEKDVKKVEAMRNELTALENDGKLKPEDAQKNKVVHRH